MNDQAKDLLLFQIRREVACLYKAFLTQIEDIKDSHGQMVNKLIELMPGQYHNLLHASNYLDQNRGAFYRKKVLDAGNESIRGLEKQIENFNIDFK